MQHTLLLLSTLSYLEWFSFLYLWSNLVASLKSQSPVSYLLATTEMRTNKTIDQRHVGACFDIILHCNNSSSHYKPPLCILKSFPLFSNWAHRILHSFTRPSNIQEHTRTLCALSRSHHHHDYLPHVYTHTHLERSLSPNGVKKMHIFNRPNYSRHLNAAIFSHLISISHPLPTWEESGEECRLRIVRCPRWGSPP